MKKEITLRQQLDSVPMKNTRLRIVKHDDCLEMEIDLVYHGMSGFLSRFMPFRKTRRFQLDGLGLEVYNKIDGKKTFEQLADDMACNHKLTFFESRGLLMQYFKTLLSKGVIVIGVPKPDGK